MKTKIKLELYFHTIGRKMFSKLTPYLIILDFINKRHI